MPRRLAYPLPRARPRGPRGPGDPGGHLAAELAAGSLTEAVQGEPVPDPRAVRVRLRHDVVDVVQATRGRLVLQPLQDEGAHAVPAPAGRDDEGDARVAPLGIEPAVPGDLRAVGHPPPLVRDGLARPERGQPRRRQLVRAEDPLLAVVPAGRVLLGPGQRHHSTASSDSLSTGRISPAACARSSTRRILPVAVVGYSVTNTIRRGRLNDGRPSRQNPISVSSSAVPPGLSCTKATGFSRPSASWAATTTAWATSACASSRASTSAGDTQMPLALSMSPVRPRQA